MKRILVMIMALVWGLVAVAGGSPQELKQVKGIPAKETKQEKKAREKKMKILQDSIAYLEASKAIDDGYFVITADRMTLGNRGITITAPDGSTNFVLVQGQKATVQIAFNNGRLGFNGLGGITVDGMINYQKKTINKKGDIYYDFSVNGAAISAQVNIVVYKNGNQASAFINPNFNSEKMTVYGPLIPYNAEDGKDACKTYKGSTAL